MTTPTSPHNDLKEVGARRRRAVATTPLTGPVLNALADITPLCAEIHYLRLSLASVRLHRANLAAAGRATLTATTDHEPNPLSYLRDELTAQGYLPSRGETWPW